MAATAMVALPIAHADTFNWGTVNFTVWTGSGIPDTATLAVAPASTPTATFTYSGPLDFVNNNLQAGSNTWEDFLTSDETNLGNLSDISSYSGETYSTFLASTMSTPGETDNSYVEITGTYNVGAGTYVTLSSDDGSSLYINPSGSSSTALISMPGPQDLQTENALLPSGSNSFTLVYDESNGAPADLQMSATPEPSSLLLLGTGLLGLAFVAFRKAKASGVALSMYSV